MLKEDDILQRFDELSQAPDSERKSSTSSGRSKKKKNFHQESNLLPIEDEESDFSLASFSQPSKIQADAKEKEKDSHTLKQPVENQDEDEEEEEEEEEEEDEDEKTIGQSGKKRTPESKYLDMTQVVPGKVSLPSITGDLGETEEEPDSPVGQECKIIFDQGTLDQIVEYKKALIDKKITPGTYLLALLKKNLSKEQDLSDYIKSLTLKEFVVYIIKTKQFVEVSFSQNPSCFNDVELSILGRINFSVKVKLYRSGSSIKGQLLFTSALSFDGSIPSFETKDMLSVQLNSLAIDRTKFFQYYQRNFLAILLYASQDALSKQKKAFITLSARDSEVFSSYFAPITNRLFLRMLKDLLETEHRKFSEIAGIYYDSYCEQEVQVAAIPDSNETIRGIHLMVGSSKEGGRFNVQYQINPSLCNVEDNEFDSCIPYSVVFNRVTRNPMAGILDPLKGDAYLKLTQTDALTILTGIEGEYKSQQYRLSTSDELDGENFKVGEIFVVTSTGLIRGLEMEAARRERIEFNPLSSSLMDAKTFQKDGIIKVNYRTDLREKDITPAQDEKISLFLDGWVDKELDLVKQILIGTLVHFNIHQQGGKKLDYTLYLRKENLTPGMIWTVVKNQAASREGNAGIDWDCILNITPKNFFYYLDCLVKFVTPVAMEKLIQNERDVVIIAETALSFMQENSIGSLLFLTRQYDPKENRTDLSIRLLTERMYQHYCGIPKPHIEECKTHEGDTSAHFIYVKGKRQLSSNPIPTLHCYFDKRGFENYAAKRFYEFLQMAYQYAQKRGIEKKPWLKIPASALGSFPESSPLGDYAKECLIRAVAKFLLNLESIFGDNHALAEWAEGALFEFPNYVSTTRLDSDDTEYYGFVKNKVEFIAIQAEKLKITFSFAEVQANHDKEQQYMLFYVVPNASHASFGDRCHERFSGLAPEINTEARLAPLLKNKGRSLTTMNKFLYSPESKFILSKSGDAKTEKTELSARSLDWLKNSLILKISNIPANSTTTFTTNPYEPLIGKIEQAKNLDAIDKIVQGNNELVPILGILLVHVQHWDERGFSDGGLRLPVTTKITPRPESRKSTEETTGSTLLNSVRAYLEYS